MSGLCKDCKWWGTAVDPDLGRPDWGRCKLSDTDYGYPIRKSSKARVYDPEIYGACLHTLHDFGCVQFETKEGVDGSR